MSITETHLKLSQETKAEKFQKHKVCVTAKTFGHDYIEK